MTDVDNEVLNKTTELLSTAFSLAAALAWNGAIQSLLNGIFGTNKSTFLAQLTYAIIVTIVAVLAIRWVAKASMKVKEIKDEIPNKIEEIKHFRK